MRGLSRARPRKAQIAKNNIALDGEGENNRMGGGGGDGDGDGGVAGVCWWGTDAPRAKSCGARCLNARYTPRYIAAIDRSRNTAPFLAPIVPVPVIPSTDYLGARIVIEVLISRDDCRRAGYS